jgi:transposase
MPKKAYLSSHFSSDELKQKYLKSQDSIESRRWHLLWKVSLGWTIKNSAVAIGINYDYAKEIVSKYNHLGEKGVENLKNKNPVPGGGKKPLLTDEKLEKLRIALKSSPSDEGIWTGPKVARWIEKENGVEKVWNQRGWDYLKKLRHSWQSPRPKHKKGSETEQEEFIENLPNILKKVEEKNPQAEVDLWFFDEHRVGLKPILRKVWSPIGERPTAIVNHRYEWLYVYGFVKPKTGDTLWYLIPRVNTKWLNLVYESFARDAGISETQKVLLIEDNAGWHRSQKCKIPEGLFIDFLPPYSPELQPAEKLWTLVDEPLVNKCFETIDEIEEILVRRCNILSEMREEIRSLTYYHWLDFH